MISKLKLVIFFVFVIYFNQGFSQNTLIASYAFDMGFAASVSSDNIIQSVVGQIFVGNSTHTNTVVGSGLLNGSQPITGIEPEGNGLAIPENFFLDQNYPNPFNPVTHIRFGLPRAEHVNIEIYNILGQRVLTLIDKQMPAGYHTVDFEANRYASGLYIYRIAAGEFHAIRKMILLK